MSFFFFSVALSYLAEFNSFIYFLHAPTMNIEVGVYNVRCMHEVSTGADYTIYYIFTTSIPIDYKFLLRLTCCRSANLKTKFEIVAPLGKETQISRSSVITAGESK